MFKEPIIKIVLSVATIVIIAMIVIYVYQLGYIFPSNVTYKEAKELREAYGVIGDFFGGVLNPFLTFCGFGFLIYTINQNSKMLDHSQEMLEQNKKMLAISQQQLKSSAEELALNRQEMELARSEMEGSKQALEMQAKILSEQAKTQEIQRFESTFFNMLEFFERYRAQIKNDNKINQKIGVETFEYWISDFITNHLLEKENDYSNTRIIKKKVKGVEGLSQAYETYYKIKTENLLMPYFNIIHQILKMIDASEIGNKDQYASIFRAQLSAHEVIMLFFYCLSRYGNEKMFPLIKKYNLLVDINAQNLLSEHLAFLDMFKPEPPQES